ncbi:MAG: 16S rRNA (adenine(1518)-N(6)/adenine(1519)-N(6))-dimethyltransferase RsmA [Alphaproteobacteria bacterium PRO2]|nr:16S rRNA (adenine(1518)-N(6)/adenine(1519)-N(6))-dimethyltransferase RsmA [Alphaproteobacteria bacterium PRO2]
MSNPDDFLKNLPPLRDVIAAYELRAKKALGQNFLLDLNITDKIARQAGDLSGKSVFEIGPGPGGLTRSLIGSNAAKIIAVEFDPRAVAALQPLTNNKGGERVEIVHGDALRVNLLDLAEGPRAIVANLPYNIATPLLTSWLKQMRERPGAFDSMTLMFQKEVAERITAVPGSKDYGRLSIISQWICDCRVCFDLPPSAFSPPPKVSSSVVHFTPKRLDKDAPDFRSVERVTAAAFGQRRKMIRGSLKDYADVIAALGLDPTLRAENLSVQDFINLAKGR